MALTQTILISTFTSSILGMTTHRKYFISALLCLEGAYSACTWPLQTRYKSPKQLPPLLMPMVLLTLSACESGAGLALMIASSRTSGTNLMSTLHTLKCLNC
uniref:NADH-ubiquinone oxidoreductase chain 4L n=1 Tax=Hemitheconyx taylori TaxID=449390 RepID=I7H0A9_9SAUR|nr:NADH dehydrogenase subunit 4L [Hemitheconyx taylori]